MPSKTPFDSIYNTFWKYQLNGTCFFIQFWYITKVTKFFPKKKKITIGARKNSKDQSRISSMFYAKKYFHRLKFLSNTFMFKSIHTSI